MPYDLFISYAHRDNERGQVRELRDAINENFERFAGRPLNIFFDENDIPSMAAWNLRIAQGLRESRLFLAVLSPSYFSSEYCRAEWEEYVRYEAMRQCLGEGIAPVYFVELPGLETGEVEESIAGWVDEIRRGRQWCDLASQSPVSIVRWHDAGRRALEDAEVAERLRVLKGELEERLSRADRAKLSPTNVCRHNPQFVGRVRELSLLREAVNVRGSVGVVGPLAQKGSSAVAVHGLGGMGKTELALAYAHAFAWDYPGGRWLATCEHISDFNLVLRQLAAPLGVEFTEQEQKDAQLAGERVLAELRQRDRSLLLLDNVDDPALLSPSVLKRLPSQDHIHVIATTRMGPAQLAGSHHDHTYVAVDEIPPDDALALIRSHQPEARFAHEDDEAAARVLVNLLGGFTLAVETAAIYLGRHAAPGVVPAYAKRIERFVLAESECSASDPSVAVRHQEKLLAQTLGMTFEALSVEQMYLLTAGSLLPADQIPLSWLRAIEVEGLPSFDRTGVREWDQCVESLISLRLFREGDNEHVVRMHRMVQELVQARARGEWASQTEREDRQPQGDPSVDPLSNLEGRLLAHIRTRAEALWTDWVSQERRWEIRSIAACARLWMDRGSEHGGYLANQAAEGLHQLGFFAEAEQLMREALESDERIFGKGDLRIATRLNNLGSLLSSMSRFGAAEDLFHRALAVGMESGPDGSRILAIAFGNLAGVLTERSSYDKAEEYYRHAIEFWETHTGLDDSDCVSAFGGLAGLLQASGRVKEALSYARTAADLARRFFGEEHPVYASSLSQLASIYHDSNRSDEAEPLLRQAVAIAETTFPGGHPQSAVYLSNLAIILIDDERHDEARSLLERALAIDESYYGKQAPSVAERLSSLAILNKRCGQLGRAEKQLLRAIDIDTSIYGRKSPKMAIRLNNLATVMNAAGRLAEAVELSREALDIDREILGDHHANVGIRLANLGSAEMACGRLEVAEEHLWESMQVFAKFMVDNRRQHGMMTDVTMALEELLVRKGMSRDEAQALVLEKCRSMMKEFLADGEHA